MSIQPCPKCGGENSDKCDRCDGKGAIHLYDAYWVGFGINPISRYVTMTAVAFDTRQEAFDEVKHNTPKGAPIICANFLDKDERNDNGKRIENWLRRHKVPQKEIVPIIQAIGGILLERLEKDNKEGPQHETDV